MDPVVGELLLASIGLKAMLEPGRVSVTKAVRARAAAIPARITRECRAFLRGGAFGPPVATIPVDFEATLERLTDGSFSLGQTLENISSIDDPDEAMALDQAARKAVAYLQQLMPTRMRETTLGPRPLPPTQQERAQFRRAYAIAHDPLSVLASMEAGSLSPAQPRVLQALYPALYEEIAHQFQTQIVEYVAAKPKANLPWGRDKVLRVFLGAEIRNKELAKQMQASFAEDAQEQRQKKQAVSAPEPTSVERISAK